MYGGKIKSNKGVDGGGGGVEKEVTISHSEMGES